MLTARRDCNLSVSQRRHVRMIKGKGEYQFLRHGDERKKVFFDSEMEDILLFEVDGDCPHQHQHLDITKKTDGRQYHPKKVQLPR